MKKNILTDKSFAFAVRIVRLARCLNDRKEFVLSKQVLRSGTAVGALVSEAFYAQSKPDFISKLSIALKEANETQYWLRLLYATESLEIKAYNSLQKDIAELLAILTSSINTAKKNLKQ